MMAKNKAKAVGKVAETAKESAKLRTLRIDGSQNGATLRTRVVRDKTKYNRNLKHKKSLADAGDFPFLCVQCYEYAKLECALFDISLNTVYIRN
jgi:hypothetical protein